jgi:hypothetical protein
MPDLDFEILFRVRFKYHCEVDLLRSVTDHTIGCGGQQTYLFALDAGDLTQRWVGRQADRHGAGKILSMRGISARLKTEELRMRSSGRPVARAKIRMRGASRLRGPLGLIGLKAD